MSVSWAQVKVVITRSILAGTFRYCADQSFLLFYIVSGSLLPQLVGMQFHLSNEGFLLARRAHSLQTYD